MRLELHVNIAILVVVLAILLFVVVIVYRLAHKDLSSEIEQGVAQALSEYEVNIK